MTIYTYNEDGRSVITRKAVLEIANLYNNPDSTIRIYSNTEGAKFKFKAFIESGFGVNLKNNWQGALEGTVASGALQEVNKWVKNGQVAANALPAFSGLAKALGSTGVRSVHETLKSYGSSQEPVFQCNAVLMSYDHTIDIITECTNLGAMCLAYKQGNLAYMAPLRYQPVLSSLNLDDLVEFAQNKEQDFSRETAPLNGGPGTLSVAIQRIFFGAGLLADSVQWTYSKEVVEDGSPVYANIQFSFVPKISPDFYQFRRYFRNYNPAKFIDGGSAQLDPSFATIESGADLLKSGVQKALEASGLGSAVGDNANAALDSVRNGLDSLRQAIGDNTTLKQ